MFLPDFDVFCDLAHTRLSRGSVNNDQVKKMDKGNEGNGRNLERINLESIIKMRKMRNVIRLQPFYSYSSTCINKNAYHKLNKIDRVPATNDGY